MAPYKIAEDVSLKCKQIAEALDAKHKTLSALVAENKEDEEEYKADVDWLEDSRKEHAKITSYATSTWKHMMRAKAGNGKKDTSAEPAPKRGRR